MDKSKLAETQGPLKSQYKDDPESAVVTLKADGDVDGSGIACRVQTSQALVEAGLHPATGGDGTQLCSGDMLLEALVACAGVTLRAVSTSMGVEIRGGNVHAEGDLDFRGHARRRQGRPRRVPRGAPALRPRHRRRRRHPRHAAQAHRAVLRRLPDAGQAAGAVGRDDPAPDRERLSTTPRRTNGAPADLQREAPFVVRGTELSPCGTGRSGCCGTACPRRGARWWSRAPWAASR